MAAPRTAEFVDAHGIAIVYDVYEAAGTPRGVVQLLHGVGGREVDDMNAARSIVDTLEKSQAG